MPLLEWHKIFRVSLHDDACPGLAHRAVVSEVHGLLPRNGRITVDELRIADGFSPKTLVAMDSTRKYSNGMAASL